MIISFKNDKPFIEGICLNEITASVETPFYLYSQKSITDAYKKLKDSLNTTIFFSIKSNSNQAIISLMKSLGAGADVVSAGELERALRAGVSPNKIIFEFEYNFNMLYTAYSLPNVVFRQQEFYNYK